MAKARPKISDDLFELSNTQWKDIINERIKNEIDRIIAIRYYLDGVPQEDIGAEVGYSRSTVRDHLFKIIKIIEKYAKK